MALSVKRKRSVPARTESPSTGVGEIASRFSQELVFSLAGPVGCGANIARDVLIDTLQAHQYDVVVVKITTLMQKMAREFNVEPAPDRLDSEFDRITAYQDLGNRLRDAIGADAGAQLAIEAIHVDRASRHRGVALEKLVPNRVAYVVDQLKNPLEASLLRDVYGNLFFLVGVLASYEQRRQNLTSAGMSPADAESLIERDKGEAAGKGQQLEKTLKLADFFVRNSNNNIGHLGGPIQRFVGLVHGKNGISPTIHERGMYAAYSAGLRSACLSRQVGAAVIAKDGSVVATGCNDVPKAGGGLYEGVGEDHRCHNWGGRCYNDKHKDILRDEIVKLLIDSGIDAKVSIGLAQRVRTETRLKDLIEFSRAVHAEMDALVSAARRGGAGTDGCLLFTTTYPCHNCARHIVAAGITEVYFIEPYGKSLASELHSDSIIHEVVEVTPSHRRTGDKGRVAFLNFEGVAPRRFSDLFYSVDSRKDSQGKSIGYVPATAQQKDPAVLDNYRQLEGRIFKRLEGRKIGSGSPL